MRLGVVTSAQQTGALSKKSFGGTIMVCGSYPRAAALIVFVAFAVVVAPITAKAQQSDDLDSARSLLVSHWEVSSDSTVKLITKAVAELRANPKIGRAEPCVARYYQ
jgi:hypothetical protein